MVPNPQAFQRGLSNGRRDLLRPQPPPLDIRRPTQCGSGFAPGQPLDAPPRCLMALLQASARSDANTTPDRLRHPAYFLGRSQAGDDVGVPAVQSMGRANPPELSACAPSRSDSARSPPAPPRTLHASSTRAASHAAWLGRAPSEDRTLEKSPSSIRRQRCPTARSSPPRWRGQDLTEPSFSPNHHVRGLLPVPSPTASARLRPGVARWSRRFDMPLFRQKSGLTRRWHAQPGRISRFFDSRAALGERMCLRFASGLNQPPDLARLSVPSWLASTCAPADVRLAQNQLRQSFRDAEPCTRLELAHTCIAGRENCRLDLAK